MIFFIQLVCIFVDISPETCCVISKEIQIKYKNYIRKWSFLDFFPLSLVLLFLGDRESLKFLSFLIAAAVCFVCVISCAFFPYRSSSKWTACIMCGAVGERKRSQMTEISRDSTWRFRIFFLVVSLEWAAFESNKKNKTFKITFIISFH